MIYPTTKGMPAGNPRDSAIASMNNASEIQAKANGAVGGRRKRVRRHIGGTTGTITVPQYQMLYEPQGGPGTNPNNQIQANAAIATQGAANSALDSGAFKKGGSKKRCKKGGNPNWLWGCMSGGKKRTKKHRKSSKKSRKNRK